MIIPITLNTPSSSSHSNSTPKLPQGLAKISNEEVVLIELQGFLDVEGSTPDERNGKFIGKLKVDDTGKPSLVIGHHLLEGKVATLAKPLAIFHREGGSGPARQTNASSASASSSASSGNSKPEGKGKNKSGMDVDGDTPRKRRRMGGGGDGEDEDEMDVDGESAGVLAKSLQASSLNDNDNGDEDEDRGNDKHHGLDDDAISSEGSIPTWTILGLVKKKITFSKRPMPISSTQGKKLGV